MASRNEPQMDRDAIPMAGFKSPSLALSAVFRAQAATNIPEAGVIGPRFRGDDSGDRSSRPRDFST
jgi:hypothetical protein